MKDIDWVNPPYEHSGTWHKKFPSIMNPNGDKITFPQLIAEYVVYCRMQVLKSYQDITYGPDWYKPIMKDIRSLNQQACAICNYFPHPDQEPLVVVAVKNIFRKQRPLTIGGFRKSRVTKNGKINITQGEKDILTAIQYELERLIKQRNVFSDIVHQIEAKKDPTFNSNKGYGKNTNIAALIKAEEKINKGN